MSEWSKMKTEQVRINLRLARVKVELVFVRHLATLLNGIVRLLKPSR